MSTNRSTDIHIMTGSDYDNVQEETKSVDICEYVAFQKLNWLLWCVRKMRRVKFVFEIGRTRTMQPSPNYHITLHPHKTFHSTLTKADILSLHPGHSKSAISAHFPLPLTPTTSAYQSRLARLQSNQIIR